MAIESLNPYLHFNGCAAQALALYEQVLGARTTELVRYEQMPGINVAAEDAGRILHAAIAIGGAVLMLSDVPSSRPVPRGGNTEVVLRFGAADELEAKFAALAEGGSVTYPVHETFFGGKLGMLSDRYGIQWMLVCQH